MLSCTPITISSASTVFLTAHIRSKSSSCTPLTATVSHPRITNTLHHLLQIPASIFSKAPASASAPPSSTLFFVFDFLLCQRVSAMRLPSSSSISHIPLQHPPFCSIPNSPGLSFSSASVSHTAFEPSPNSFPSPHLPRLHCWHRLLPPMYV